MGEQSNNSDPNSESNLVDIAKSFVAIFDYLVNEECENDQDDGGGKFCGWAHDKYVGTTYGTLLNVWRWVHSR